MERDFFDENFEWFLRRNANNHRMEAPDRVWNKISRELGRRRRRISYTLGSVILLTSVLGYYFLGSPVKPISVEASNPGITAAALKPSPNEFNSTHNNTSALNVDQAGRIILKEVSGKLSPVSSNPEIIASVPEPVETRKMDSPNPVTEPAQPLAEPAIAHVSEGSEAIQTDQVEDAPEVNEPTSEQPESQAFQAAPMTVESVLNSYSPRRKKFSVQVSFTPSISYRKLGENKSYLRNPAANSVNFPPLYNINSAVTHKPDIGFEIGVSSKYALTSNIKLTGGIQFNVNRYDIKAFEAPYTVATIQLNTASGVASLNTVSPYSNTPSARSSWLKNFYLQVSAPVGIELKLRGDDKMQFGIASTIQPSYMLGDRAYLITSNYKSYAQVPGLIRRWNASTNLHTFVSYSAGKMKWQVGPQVRYQLLSSFVSKYPVKENLFDFGMRVGVTLSKD